MAVRTVTVRLNAEASNMIAELQKAEIAARKVAAEGRKTEAALQKAGSGLLKFGAAGVAGFALVGKAAIDWESQWTGVTKTVDGTTEQMAQLESELRNMATSLPATHEEIAAVAEAAGQLGISREDVSSFTKTMIDLGETTNLTAEEAATSLAQFSNIMGTSADDVDRLGATIVELGNNGASTERDIVRMGLRIAGAGNQIGLSETEVLAYASALSSVGIEAEAGGTAISTFMLKTEKAVRAGGEELDVLAKTAGMTSDEFKRAFETDAAGALDAFLQGLGDAQAAGEDTNAILEALGATGIREADALRRLAASGTLLSESLDTGNRAWESNTALLEEAEKRYNTTASQIQVAWNQIKDAAIDAGAVILPAIAGVADVVGGLAGAFQSMPDGAKSAITGIGGVATAAALLAGGGLKAFTAIRDVRQTLKDLSGVSPRAEKGLRGVGKGLGVIAAAGAALAIIGAIQDNLLEIPESGAQARQALVDLVTYADENGLDDFFTIKGGGVNIEGIDEAIDALVYGRSQINQFGSDFAGMFGITDELAAATSQFKALDAQLAQMDTEEAAAAFDQLYAKFRDKGFEDSEILAFFPQYAEQVRQAALEAGKGVPANDDLSGSMRGASTEAERAAKELADYTSEIQKNAEQALAASDAQIGFEQAVDDAAEAVKENGRTLDLNTQAGRDNQTQLNTLVGQSKAMIQTLKDQNASTKEVTAAQQRAEDQIYKAGRAMGKSEGDARAYAQQMLGIPSHVDTSISTPGSKLSKKEIDDINRKLRDIPPEKAAKIVATFHDKGVAAGKKLLDSVHSKSVTVTTHFRSTGDPNLGTRVGNRTVYMRASGGVLPGFTPGKDVHHFTSKSGIDLHLSGGEAIMRPEFTRAVGGAAGVDRLNAAARSGGPLAFADGGVFNGPQRYVAAPVSAQATTVDRAAPRTTVQQYFTQVNPDAALIAAGQRLKGLR